MNLKRDVLGRKWIICILSVFFFFLNFAAYGYEDFKEMAKIEADYILRCQFIDDDKSPAYGCINNLYGPPTWVVPRANAMAILGLIKSCDILGDGFYLERAQLAADYLIRVQDTDGGWFNQYNFAEPGKPANPANKEALAKSPAQTAEVMIALYHLGFQPQRYAAMKKAAGYLIACQKNGGDGYLLGAGKDDEGNFRSWRWTSDNSYAYQALKAAEIWAINSEDYKFALFCANAARKIIIGIDSILYIKNPADPDCGVWYRVVDEKNEPVDIMYHDWINYAPQMMDLPAYGVNRNAVGEWIHKNLQQQDYSCVGDEGLNKSRKSPGFSFQAVLCWRDLGQKEYYIPALDWALKSGLWQTRVDENGAIGGWGDWRDDQAETAAFWWERFIDTSFYAIAAFNNGYNFSVVPSYLRISYRNPKTDLESIPCYLQLKVAAEESQ